MNRRALISSALAAIGAALMPWRKRGPSKEEMQRALDIAANRWAQDHPEEFRLAFEELLSKLEWDHPFVPCERRPGCPAPRGSLCGRCVPMSPLAACEEDT